MIITLVNLFDINHSDLIKFIENNTEKQGDYFLFLEKIKENIEYFYLIKDPYSDELSYCKKRYKLLFKLKNNMCFLIETNVNTSFTLLEFISQKKLFLKEFKKRFYAHKLLIFDVNDYKKSEIICESDSLEELFKNTLKHIKKVKKEEKLKWAFGMI